MDEDSMRNDERTTLVLGDNRIEVHKGKLASKSRYFACLFSRNFNDYRKDEHVINYDVSFSTLQNFVEWVHDDEEPVEHNCHLTKNSLMKFWKYMFEDLLNLLQLSVLFMADSLTDEFIDIVVLNWLMPETVIDVWLLAQELGINVLRDVCFSVCLDHFEELPISSLVELSQDNVLLLVRNVNVRSSRQHLEYVWDTWAEQHMIFDNVDMTTQRVPKFVHSMVGHTFNALGSKEAFVYTWDGAALSKLVQLKDIKILDRDLIGMQVTGRGFSVYMVGGEMGLGTGHFNTVIWRYCLISKKWYYQARLPVARRHMITVFIQNKLLVLGGVGRHRLKLSTVDVFNVHTGEWRKAAKIPEEFTEVPPHCVVSGKLYYLKSCLYLYYPKLDLWQRIVIGDDSIATKINTLVEYNTTLFWTGTQRNKTILSRIDTTSDNKCTCSDNAVCHHRSLGDMRVVSVQGNSHVWPLRFTYVGELGILFLGVPDEDVGRTYLHLHTEIRSDLYESTFNPRLGYFNIIKTENLYDTVPS